MGIEHHHGIAHVVEGDAQLALALAQLVQQAGILHGDDGLVGEGLQ